MRPMEVFECSCTERGRKCASEFTRTNAFAPMLKTLTRKNPGGVTMETIAESAICPFHARILKLVRTDIVRMDDVLSKFFELTRRAREEERERHRFAEEKARRHARWLAATTTTMGQALQAALKK